MPTSGRKWPFMRGIAAYDCVSERTPILAGGARVEVMCLRPKSSAVAVKCDASAPLRCSCLAFLSSSGAS
eukprot:scaffold28832_cov36-Tisochrysis_lutea.AAC.1